MPKILKKFILGLMFASLLLVGVGSIKVFAADNPGFNTIDIIDLKASTMVPRYILESFKATIDASMGVINLLDQNQPMYKAFLLLAAPLFAIMLLWEIIKVLMGKTKIQKLFVNFITALVMPGLYIGVMMATVWVANLMITGLMGTDSFVTSVNRNIYYFVTAANDSLEAQSVPERLFNEVFGLINRTSVNPITTVATTNPTTLQYKLIVQIISWIYFASAIVNWFAMFIIDWYLKILVFLSPVVAVSHINGWGNGFVKKFWAAFSDCLIAKLAFHLVYFLVNESIKTQINNDIKGVNLGFALYCICSFSAMAVIVLKVRELFDFIDTSYNSVEQTNNSPLSMVQNVAGGTVNMGSRAMQTISSFGNFKK
jgi:hypothetical protein